MKHFFSAALLAIVFLSAAAQADEKADIQAAYDQANQASAKLDAKGATAHYTADYENISSKGQSSKGADERAMQMEFLKHTKSFKGTTKITGFKLENNNAHVRVKEHVECLTQDPQTGNFINLVEDDTCNDEWTKTPQGWRLTRSKNENSVITVNGKKVD